MTHKLVEKNGSSFTGGEEKRLEFGGSGSGICFLFFWGVVVGCC